MKKTKIIATIGPVNGSKDTIRQMILAGMDVVRINLSHADHKAAETIIKTIRDLNKELNTTVGILVDTKGPEMRIKTPQECGVELMKGDIVTLTNNECDLENKFYVTYRNLYEDVCIGSKFLLDDGLLEFIVIDIKKQDIICEVMNDGLLVNNKRLNAPGMNLSIDFLSTDDKDDITFASNQHADFIALSFVRNANDVLDVNDMLIGLRDEHIQIIAKIECRSAIDDIENIIKVSDGIMVARGDLGVEINLEEVPGIQKRIVKQAYLKNKLCIVATEMLSSMEERPRPTRAEVSDVANAVIDGVDAVMLSGETAVGKYPVETIDTMRKIIESTESESDYGMLLDSHSDPKEQDMTAVIAHSVVNAANMLKAKAIVASTISGYTARKVSSFRPCCPIITTTPDKKTATSLSLNWGVIPVVVEMFKSTDEIVKNAIEIAKEKLVLQTEDKIIITGGFPVKKIKYTNFMKIEEIE